MRVIHRPIRVSTLQWIIGAYCVIRGAMVLIVPHQFSTTFQAPLEPYLLWIGSTLLLGGGALIAAGAQRLARAPRVVAHLLSGGALLQIAFSSTLTGAWVGFGSFLVLGVGTVLAGLLSPAAPGLATGEELDLYGLLMGLVVALTGVVFLLPVSQFEAALYDLVRPNLAWYGAAFIGSGLLLALLLLLRASWLALVVGHLLAGGALVVWAIGLGLPNWSVVLYYVGLGGALALLPWLGPALQRFDPALLQARVALALAGGVVLPLIAGVALITSQEERAASYQALALQQSIAVALAEQVASSIQLHRAATVALAETPGLASQSPDQQRAALRRYSSLYPDMISFATYDANGNPLARSDDRPLGQSMAGLAIYEDARRTNMPALEIRIARTLQRPVFAFGAPMLDSQGRFDGLVIGNLESEQVFEQLTRASAELDAVAYLVDERGRVIAHPDRQLVETFADRSELPPVVALRESVATGALRYQDREGLVLAGYAPVRGLGWGVFVERPANVALASVHARRDRDFGVLLLVTIGMLGVGVLVARWVVAPLATLARAAGRLAAGDDRAPLPQSSVAEVARLAGSFGEMRARLTERTSERDTAEQKIRFLAEASSALAVSLDYETTLQTVVRLAVSGLADYCVLDILADGGAIQRVATAHADPAKAGLVRALGDFPPQLSEESRIARAIHTGVPDLLSIVPDTLLDALAYDDRHLRVMRALEPASLMTVPLIARGRTFGVISLVRTDAERHYQAADVLLADELARRAAVAIDNAGLYREAQVAVQLRDQFLSVASHELKNPLTALLGNAQLLQRRTTREGQLNERNQRAIEVIVEQSARLNKMIAALLDISRIEHGRLSIEHNPVDMDALVRRVVEEAQPTLEHHSVTYEAPQETLTVDGDELRLEQVLQNLISNAIKYSPQGGAIVVRVARRPALAGSEQAGEQVCIAVSDQGIGIPAEALPRLFGRFYRAPNVDTDHISGMGIGLYVVHEIVALHGGVVEVDSTIGVGSTFSVCLPLAEQPEIAR
jgi:signal transduction histidine kinase/HAMP domain-containing protein